MKRILLTGGGSAGHVTPNVALVPSLRREGFEIHYAGGRGGMERALASPVADEYHAVSSGKLRRYFDLKNFTDIFKVAKGFFDAIIIIGRVKPLVVFSKGGYVSVPVVAAAWLFGVPVVAHESDFTPGLANRLSFPFAKTICVSFPETLDSVPKKKSALTGTPVRESLLDGDIETARKICGFEADKPAVLIVGGSQGAASINKSARAALPRLLEKYNVVHLCGKGNIKNCDYDGYFQLEYAENELPHLYAQADVIVSRAGANTIGELVALRKPNILVPLPRQKTSRGDQASNAESMEGRGLSTVIMDRELTPDKLADAIDELYVNKDAFAERIEAYGATQNAGGSAIEKIVGVILAAAKKTKAGAF
ncbi:MAG: undecaprenyldiphospho-muramoylpentapeptide beta-N-acetylglucosaminyltransferase [Defluviitaleaceae bacterium]|nr:undecaprenyldiphospho-muramoylpentapeptide beta-N-acetylglucosaminyltransferase [Defluviitaleaceae bacterium]